MQSLVLKLPGCNDIVSYDSGVEDSSAGSMVAVVINLIGPCIANVAIEQLVPTNAT